MGNSRTPLIVVLGMPGLVLLSTVRSCSVIRPTIVKKNEKKRSSKGNTQWYYRCSHILRVPLESGRDLSDLFTNIIRNKDEDLIIGSKVLLEGTLSLQIGVKLEGYRCISPVEIVLRFRLTLTGGTHLAWHLISCTKCFFDRYALQKCDGSHMNLYIRLRLDLLGCLFFNLPKN